MRPTCRASTYVLDGFIPCPEVVWFPMGSFVDVTKSVIGLVVSSEGLVAMLSGMDASVADVVSGYAGNGE